MTGAYFGKLQKALAAAGLAEPVLLIDRARLNANIKQLTAMLPRGMAYRIVAKSLPSLPLLQHVMAKTKTDRLMSFNRLMSEQLLQALPQADQLLGKPLPVAAAAALFDGLSAAKGKKAAKQIRFLVDTPARLEQYAALAQRLGLSLRINLELDIGLHRGGLTPGPELQAALDKLAQTPHLGFDGFMGYEPHLTKVPAIGGWRKRAQKGAWDQFAASLSAAAGVFGDRHVKAMLRNMAGSPTFGLYKDAGLANELAAGSALVKPSDFDLPILKAFEPAVFIATPALKVARQVQMPAFEHAGRLLGKPRAGTTVFTHGGYWMAAPVHPRGLKNSALFGRSSNQEMWLGPKRLDLKVDDFVFLRPTQSEAVFLQFPQIAVYEKGKIADIWEPLAVSA